MPTGTRHRKTDLLFGLLAQQMSLITSEQLLEAVNLWIEDPSRPMGSLLRQLGHIGPDEDALLLEAVEMHKSPTDGDTAMERAISIDPAVREAILALRPPIEIRQWLVRLHDRKNAPPVPQGPPPVSRAERYELGTEIARGGLGRVLEAHDRDLEREVAVKLVLDDVAPWAAERFTREAKITARLDHPAVVPIHDFGTLPGKDGKARLFLCMKRIRGRDLGAILQGLSDGDAELRERWTRARLLGVFQDICLGMAYAHSKGVIHRDLKPSNVMIGDFGETLIVDWGLAKELKESDPEGNTRRIQRPNGGAPSSARSDITTDGDIVGTPAYMPPEQAGGRGEFVDERSDVFALGAILYAMLTLSPPWKGDSATAVLESVRIGRIDAPSTRIVAASLSGVPLVPPSERGTAEPIPPELDAICLRALAVRREDRFATALDLHHEIQLFLEGVKERERKLREAAERLAEGQRWRARYAELGREITTQAAAVEALHDSIESWRSAVEKKPLWDAEVRYRALEDERVDVESRALAAFSHALAADPACAAAAEGACEVLYERCLEAEASKDRKGLLHARKAMAQHDRGGVFAARLDAPGTLSIRAFSYGCPCLRPVAVHGWRVAFGAESTVPMDNGAPRVDRPPADKERVVPEIRTSPAGAVYGHGADCQRREEAGIPVFISRYEEREKRLLPGPERAIGLTPLAAVTLPVGSYRCVLRPPGRPEVLVPVRIERAGHWEQMVTIYSAAEIPDGFRLVSGGPFIFGGENAGGYLAETRITCDAFVATFPVTCGDYLEFLASLPSEEAQARVPREGEKRWWIVDAAGIRMPRSGEDPRFEWDARWPVFAVSWLDGLAYCAWRSARDGRVYTLPHEELAEKTARGVDGRIYAFGDEHDPAYAHCNQSLKGRLTPMPVGSFPADESPYGVRDLTGGVGLWCQTASPVPYREWRTIRGGAWSTTGPAGKAGARVGNPPTRTSWSLGLRLSVSPFRWPTRPA